MIESSLLYLVRTVAQCICQSYRNKSSKYPEASRKHSSWTITIRSRYGRRYSKVMKSRRRRPAREDWTNWTVTGHIWRRDIAAQAYTTIRAFIIYTCHRRTITFILTPTDVWWNYSLIWKRNFLLIKIAILYRSPIISLQSYRKRTLWLSQTFLLNIVKYVNLTANKISIINIHVEDRN